MRIFIICLLITLSLLCVITGSILIIDFEISSFIAGIIIYTAGISTAIKAINFHNLAKNKEV